MHFYLHAHVPNQQSYNGGCFLREFYEICVLILALYSADILSIYLNLGALDENKT